MFNPNSGSASSERKFSSGGSDSKADQLPTLNPVVEAFKSAAIAVFVIGDMVFRGGKGLKDYVDESDLDN